MPELEIKCGDSQRGEEGREEGNKVPCDAAKADVICHFLRQGQCYRGVQWACKSDNREICARTPEEIAGCL